MTKKRRRSHHTPSGPSLRRTMVRDPRAVVRFSLDDRVVWEGEDYGGPGVVVGFSEDECLIKIRWPNGSTTMAPTFTSRLRRVPDALEEATKTTLDDALKIGEPTVVNPVKTLLVPLPPPLAPPPLSDGAEEIRRQAEKFYSQPSRPSPKEDPRNNYYDSVEEETAIRETIDFDPTLPGGKTR